MLGHIVHADHSLVMFDTTHKGPWIGYTTAKVSTSKVHTGILFLEPFQHHFLLYLLFRKGIDRCFTSS